MMQQVAKLLGEKREEARQKALIIKPLLSVEAIGAFKFNINMSGRYIDVFRLFPMVARSATKKKKKRNPLKKKAWMMYQVAKLLGKKREEAWQKALIIKPLLSVRDPIALNAPNAYAQSSLK